MVGGGEGRKATATGRKTIRLRGIDVDVDEFLSEDEGTEDDLQERREWMRAEYRSKCGVGPEYGV